MRALFLLLILAFLSSHCLAASKANDCVGYYFGLGAEQDFKKALKACADDDDISILALMYLNGEGTPPNLEVVQALVDRAAAKEKGWGPDATLRHLQKIITERRANPSKIFPKLTYNEIAMTTPDMNRMMSISNQLQEQAAIQAEKKLEAAMSATEAALLRDMRAALTRWVKAAGQRMYKQYEEGTIRGLASLGYESYLNKRHQRRVDTWLIKRSLPQEPLQALGIVDKDLNDRYQKIIKRKEREIAEAAKEEAQRADSLREYIPLLREEQRAWIIYRDAWVNLLKVYSPQGAYTDEKIEEFAKVKLTRERVVELKYDPIGPD